MLIVFSSLGGPVIASVLPQYKACKNFLMITMGGISYDVLKFPRRGTQIQGVVCGYTGHKATVKVNIGDQYLAKTANALKGPKDGMVCEKYTLFGASSKYSISCFVR
ncbi:MAG: hypothetical protein LBV61_02950 [Burkholderiaceae bacterium]|nr:hypothetical protein [Burkholderiaceae bacterium]